MKSSGLLIPRYDSLASLAGYYSLYAQRFLSLASLGCHLEVAERLPDCPLDSKVRHSLFLAFKEALNNVVRHAEASEVRLRILVEDEELIVAITDNGRGLQPAAEPRPAWMAWPTCGRDCRPWADGARFRALPRKARPSSSACDCPRIITMIKVAIS